MYSLIHVALGVCREKFTGKNVTLLCWFTYCSMWNDLKRDPGPLCTSNPSPFAWYTIFPIYFHLLTFSNVSTLDVKRARNCSFIISRDVQEDGPAVCTDWARRAPADLRCHMDDIFYWLAGSRRDSKIESHPPAAAPVPLTHISDRNNSCDPRAAREINQNDCFPKLMNAKGAQGGVCAEGGGVGGGISHASFMSSMHERQGRAQTALRAGVPQPSQREGGEKGGRGHELGRRLLSAVTWSEGPRSTHHFVGLLPTCERRCGMRAKGPRMWQQIRRSWLMSRWPRAKTAEWRSGRRRRLRSTMVTVSMQQVKPKATFFFLFSNFVFVFKKKT